MSFEKYKLVRSDNPSHGNWVSDYYLKSIIKVSYKRNNKLHLKSIEWYEHLTGEKFDYGVIGIETIKKN